MLGLCNNFPYVVMLSAAFDILSEVDKSPSHTVSVYVCLLCVGVSVFCAKVNLSVLHIPCYFSTYTHKQALTFVPYTPTGW